MRNTIRTNIKGGLYKLAPLALFIVAWYLFTVGHPRRVFFLGSPKGFFLELYVGLKTKVLLRDLWTTGTEAISGLMIGNAAGAAVGFWMWRSRAISRILSPYIIVLGSAPLFAFAPIIVLGFGIGWISKVVVVIVSTFFTALVQSFRGAEEADPQLIEVVRSFGGDERQALRKVVVPSSLVWVASALRINVGLALLGAFLGEYISSEGGLGHRILLAGNLYNTSLVLVAVMLFGVLGLLMSWGIARAATYATRRIIAKL